MMVDDIWLPVLVLLGVTSFFLLRGLGQKSDRRRLPPSPSGAWPILGHSLILKCELPHRRLMELAKEYGSLMHIRLLKTPAVVISSADMLREFYQVNDVIMASRPHLSALYILGYDGNNIGSHTYDNRLRHLRKLVTQELLSMKRVNELQAVRRREVLQTVESISYRAKQSSNSSVNLRQELRDMTSNNITQMLSRKRYFGPKIDSEMQAEEFSRLMDQATLLSLAFDIGDYIPFLKPFDLQGNIKKLHQTKAWFNRFIENILVEHRTDTTGGATRVKDFIDTLLELQRKEDVSDDELKGVVYDLLLGATDTSASVIEWLLAELQIHPKWMVEIQKELDEVVGRNRIVNESDIPNLKYLQVCVKESMRLHTTAPLSLPHESTASCTVAGYHIPAKVRVIVNVAAIHLNPETYDEPDTFRPERFLPSGRNSAMEVKGQHFDLVPFGTGRRMCIGMNLGLLMVHLGAAVLLQSFDWKLPPESLDMSESFGLVAHKKVALQLVPTTRLAAHVYAAENLEMEE